MCGLLRGNIWGLFCALQDVWSLGRRSGDDVLGRKWIFDVLQQPALAQPLPVCLQTAGPGAHSALRESPAVPDVSVYLSTGSTC